MSTNDSKKKFKRPKQKTLSTTNPETPVKPKPKDVKKTREPLCPLLAKDSEWVDILQTQVPDAGESSANTLDDEAVLQLVECEDGPEMKPLAIMFPDLLEKDPLLLQGMLNKAMSTTEVTRHLVDLGQKANFTFMKKADRLIPPNKLRLESLTESNNSCCSAPDLCRSYVSSDYEADTENTDDMNVDPCKKKKRKIVTINGQENIHSSSQLTLFGIEANTTANTSGNFNRIVETAAIKLTQDTAKRDPENFLRES